MPSLNEDMMEYTEQLRKGQIQRAYRGIQTFMSKLKIYVDNRYNDYKVSELYVGYMDMTYFAVTPSALKDKQLKIAVVYLHEQNRFELWLAGRNRQVQAAYIEFFHSKDLGSYRLSEMNPGVDSIIEGQIFEHPDFENSEGLMLEIEQKLTRFIDDILLLVEE